MKIADIDPNFKDTPVADCKVEYFNVNDADKFSLSGVFYDAQKQAYTRVDRETIDAMGDAGMENLSYCTAGGEVRFTTDSPVLVLRAKLLNEGDMPHMPRTGSAGFDFFCDGKFAANLKPLTPADTDVVGMGFNDPDGEKKLRQFSLLLPLYNGVVSLEIGVVDGCEIQPVTTHRKRVLFYGSSITQGGCASKPGNAYPAMIARWQGLEQINLGFSGNARGREPMTKYVASLKPDIFVMDYDYNAPDAEHLAATHEPMFKVFREANPDTPVIFVTNPNDRPERYPCKDVVIKTYRNAIAAGDDNVFFIDGGTLLEGVDRDACTMDGVHPNDLGFFRMATVIGRKIAEVF